MRLNIQVATSAEGVLQTIKPIKGAYYDFYAVGDNLVVVEVGVLSHNAMLLRPVTFQDRHVHFLIQLKPANEPAQGTGSGTITASSSDGGAQLDSSSSSSMRQGYKCWR
eukprot:1136766-Pelagomonas_calceolata.AAC.1